MAADTVISRLGAVAQKFRKAIASTAYAVLPTADTAVTGAPTITSGTGAPSATPPDGSIYLRTDGASATTVYVRVSSAWETVTSA